MTFTEKTLKLHIWRNGIYTWIITLIFAIRLPDWLIPAQEPSPSPGFDNPTALVLLCWVSPANENPAEVQPAFLPVSKSNKSR